MENFSELHNVCIKVFEAIAQTTSIFVIPFFMVKIVFSNILGEGAKVFAVFKGAVVYFCLIAAFPMIVELLFSIPESYLPKYESLSYLSEGSPGYGFSSIPFSVDRVLEVLLAGLYWLVYYLHVFFMLAMCSMAPIVFLSSTLLGIGLGVEIFMGLLIVGSSWPIIWYGFDQVHANLLSAQADEFGAKCLELLLTLFKGLAPVSFATLVVKSGPGKSIFQATQMATSSGQKLTASQPNFSRTNYHANSHQLKSELNKTNEKSSLTESKKFLGKENTTSSSNRLIKAQKQIEKGEKNENPRP